MNMDRNWDNGVVLKADAKDVVESTKSSGEMEERVRGMEMMSL